MANILNIETSANLCSVALGRDGKLIAFRQSDEPNVHAARCPVFIEEVLQAARIHPGDLQAVAVSAGPGSYTGLRIGMSLAKGMCYALNLDLIAVPTLQIMAYGAVSNVKDPNALYVPLLDARRMEVYSATYDHNCKMISPVKAEIINSTYHQNLLEQHTVCYSGNGAIKLQTILNNKNAMFLNIFGNSAENMVYLSQEYFYKGSFVSPAYFEPTYLKLFHELL